MQSAERGRRVLLLSFVHLRSERSAKWWRRDCCHRSKSGRLDQRASSSSQAKVSAV
jgi:hypothetical protein